MTTDNRTIEFLAEQKRLAEAATEGPWEPALDESVAADDWPVTTPSGDYLGRSPDDGVRAGFELADAEFIAAARESVPRMIAALEAVMTEHQPVQVEPSETICDGCSTLRGAGENARYFPHEEWPCPTIRAIEAALGGDGDD